MHLEPRTPGQVARSCSSGWPRIQAPVVEDAEAAEVFFDNDQPGGPSFESRNASKEAANESFC